MNKFQNILKDGDLRSIGKANDVVAMVNSQEAFDDLFIGLHNSDRKIVMRTVDAIEKITLHNADFLQKHRIELIELLNNAVYDLYYHLLFQKIV